VLDASQVVIKQPTNRGSVGERKWRGGEGEAYVLDDITRRHRQHRHNRRWDRGGRRPRWEAALGRKGSDRGGGDAARGGGVATRGSGALLPSAPRRRGGDRGIGSHCCRGEDDHTGRRHASTKSNQEEEECRAVRSDEMRKTDDDGKKRKMTCLLCMWREIVYGL
jgi:hypothetical protein